MKELKENKAINSSNQSATLTAEHYQIVTSIDLYLTGTKLGFKVSYKG